MKMPVPIRLACPACGDPAEAINFDPRDFRIWWAEHWAGRECQLTADQFGEAQAAWRAAKQQQWASEL